MKKLLFLMIFIISLYGGEIFAVPVIVDGSDSIFATFGSTSGAGSGATLAPSVTISEAQSYYITATGWVNCCGHNDPNHAYSGGPDGLRSSPFFSDNINPTNGLSGVIGNSFLPLLGVFTSETDPRDGAAPATLTYDADAPLSLSPVLNQVFYIGDGRTGYEDTMGDLLSFSAPMGATRLYLGLADSSPSTDPSNPCCYGDNPGSFTAEIAAVPIPGAVWLLGSGLLGLVAVRRRKGKE